MVKMKEPKRIAVIGAGVSGLAAAWRLALTHDVTLYESAPTLGGHANTVAADISGRQISVDTGFIVFNPKNYPNFCALLDYFGIASSASDMSFSASIGDGNFEYSSDGIAGLFAQKRNWFRPRMWSMLADLVRLYRGGRSIQDDDLETTLDEFLVTHGYSETFREDHILPMCAAIWSSPVETMRHYPARSFFAFFENHGLLQFGERPEWRTVTGGSRTYVDALRRAFRGQVKLDRTVTNIERLPQGIAVLLDDGGRAIFDEVVLACHSDQALTCLGNQASVLERAVLGAIRYQPNTAILHRDTSFMPKKRAAWASWNYCRGQATGTPDSEVSLTYWMNRLQPLETDEPIFVTLNPDRAPDARQTIASFDYAHPVFDREALIAQEMLHEVQGQNRVWFCGAWMGSGFHEDGLQGGLAVAEALGAPIRPWEQDRAASRIHWPDYFKRPVADNASHLVVVK